MTSRLPAKPAQPVKKAAKAKTGRPAAKRSTVTSTRTSKATGTTAAHPIVEMTPERPMDGRAARAVRTRTVIVDALLGLLEEGDLQPPASRIAERAGISLRLIYHHFGDLESLFSATATREAERLAARATPIDLTRPLADRIDQLVEQRSNLLEWLTPVRRAALLQEPFSDELQAARDGFLAAGEEQVRTVFAAEFAAWPEPGRETRVSAVHGTLLWGHWNDLRVSGRSIDEARAALHLTVSALITRA